MEFNRNGRFSTHDPLADCLSRASNALLRYIRTDSDDDGGAAEAALDLIVGIQRFRQIADMAITEGRQ